MDDEGNQADGTDANGHGSALLLFALFLQPMTMVGKLHVCTQFRCHDVDGDGWMFRLYFTWVDSHH